ncbi:hypothetical protein IMSHALPRED_011122 [Imshaugia aleurites]|uniref:Anaphase-promoting complex subunit 15 n=1 Tax=Imshaugia aleurites TaxID=172621 RepID=A0A8H3GCH2_9LECA|nr:hypothetical protein IMSHALPRED_011122 [Imshaugia aleurites]
MLSSLPTLHPPPPHTLFHPTLTAPPPSSTNSHPNTPDHHPHQQQPPTPHPHPHRPHQTPLSALHIDEQAIRARKTHIRRFGSNWLRPPGVSKTLQGMADERAEREEGELARAREVALVEAQAAAEAEMEVQGMGMAVGGGGEEEGGGGLGETERDLDAEIRDMDADADADGWSEVSDEDVVEGLEGAEQSLLGGEGDGEGGGEVDLDAEVPEGSYEHTDTEIEDESSDDGGVFGGEGPLGSSLASGVLGSSVFGGSPVVGGRGRGRGMGREN